MHRELYYTSDENTRNIFVTRERLVILPYQLIIRIDLDHYRGPHQGNSISQYDGEDIAIMNEIDTFPCGVFVNREPFDREKRASMIFGTRGGIACDLFQEREGDNPAIMRCDKSGKRRPRSSKKRGEKETRERKKGRRKKRNE